MKLTPEQVLLGAQMISSGLDFWQKFSNKIANDEATPEDLEVASKLLDKHIEEFEGNVNAGKQNPTG